ncbi:signal peptidase I [Streptomyces sp. CAU 1734]|uniref:signal peptidase I n=1 Tax=Streptomyces sp. CAU 1734 TaxID=3140360 RepID=UPI0032619538
MAAAGRENNGRGRLGSALSGVAVAVGFVLFLGGFIWGAVIYQPYTVPTDSMSPAVRAGDRVLAQRVDGDRVRRGDIVVFRDREWSDVLMVKRVVGVGGDTVACCGAGGRLTVNGEPVDEPYLSSGGPASAEKFTADVPDGQLFLLGDERTGSLDSRSRLQEAGEGSVARSSVVGRLDAVAWPLPGEVLERPGGFARLPGGVSEVGPIRLITSSVLLGAALIVGGAAYGPVVERLARRAGGQGRGGAADAG